MTNTDNVKSINLGGRAPLAFLDTETTGLHPDDHGIWEVGLITTEWDLSNPHEYHWFLPVDLKNVEEIALQIGGFRERYIMPDTSEYKSKMHGGDPFNCCNSDDWFYNFLEDFRELTEGRHLVGAVISFDEERLRRMMYRYYIEPVWHYHLVDVEALMAGKLGQPPPWNSQNLADVFGVTITEEERHTALGDAWWAMRSYAAVMELEVPKVFSRN